MSEHRKRPNRSAESILRRKARNRERHKERMATEPEYRARYLAQRRKRERERYNSNPEFRKANYERTRAWAKANPEKTKEHQKNYYQRLRKEIYDTFFAEQKGLCAICKEPSPPEGPAFHIDHDHASGEVRGLLCRRCNWLLGHAEDSVDRLNAAIDYLRRA